MDSGLITRPKRDPKMLTGLSKRFGAVSNIAKSFENSQNESRKSRRQAKGNSKQETAKSNEQQQQPQQQQQQQQQQTQQQHQDSYRQQRHRLLQQQRNQQEQTQRSSFQQQKQQQLEEQEQLHLTYQQQQQQLQQQQQQQLQQQQPPPPFRLKLQPQQSKQLQKQESFNRGKEQGRESYREPFDSLHLPRPTFTSSSNQPHPNNQQHPNNQHPSNHHLSYDDPRTPNPSLTNVPGRFRDKGHRLEAGGDSDTASNPIITPPPKFARNPTLGELLRGDVGTSSSRSFEVPSLPISQENRPSRFSLREGNPQMLKKPGGKSISEQNLSPSRRSTANISQMVSNSREVEKGRIFGAKPPTPVPQRSTRVVSPMRRPFSPRQIGVEQDGKREEQRTNNNNREERDGASDHTYDLDIRENGDSTSFTTDNEDPPNTAYPDHPERDSLDGHLPGSSHGTGNPPPPPTPPSPPASSAKPTAGFTKGPNAKNKKHKKLKNEADDPSGGSGGTTSEGGGGGQENNHTRKKKEKNNATDKDTDRDMEAGGGYRPKTEPYSYLWVVLSGLYGKLVVLLMLAFCLTEVLDNSVTPFTFQGVFLMYLYVGSILAIMCIYVTVIVDNCPSVSASKENLTKQDDPEVGSITSFGTLKRAHISRSKTSRTSFYLRVGALVFGLGTLIFNGLEIAMHSTMQGECVKDIVFAHPILQALFTFLQMHFLFVNSEVIVEKFGQVARFGFMHLVATNIAVWVRMVVWESATVWIEDTYAGKSLGDVPGQAEQVLRLYNCFNNNSLGRLWTDAQPYLFPFLVQYSLIAAAVTYVMWCNVGKEKLKKLGHLAKAAMEDSATLDKRGIRKGYWKVDCRSASKGLFLGLLCLVGGIVVLIIFFVMKDQEEFKTKLFWICNGTQTIILSLSVINTVIGFLQIPKLSVSTSKPLDLDRLLLSSTIAGVYVFAIFGMIVGGVRWDESEYLATFCLHALLLVQVSLQDMLVAEASRRTCTSRYQMLTKPGRQVITFLLFSNITLWILDTFMTHTSVTQNFQYGFYGVLAWGVISRISLPLLILYRFHSAVILVEIWKNTYRTKAD